MENGVVNLANHFPTEEVSTTFLCLEQAGEFANRLKPGIPVHTLGRRAGWDWAACKKLARHLRNLQPSLIHTHNLGPLIYAAVARLISPTLWGTPIMHGEHGALQGDGLSARRLKQRRLFYRICKLVHTVSAGLREELITRGLPAKKIVSILNGVDCDRFRPVADKQRARLSTGLPENAFVLGAVGRFIATKRYPLMVEAFELLAKDWPELHLMILGDGGAERETVRERVCQSPHADRIHVMGHQQEPAPFYQAMDILVMPSSHEGLANALLEAMASGVPVLAHAACGAGEVIQNGSNGFLQEIQTAADLAEYLTRLRSQPELLSTVSQKARESAQCEFSLSAMVNNYLSAYRQVANSPAAPVSQRGNDAIVKTW
jgi:glycosyltransferase involved in cell wall biosynthesis